MASHRLESSPETVHWGFFDAKLPPQLTIDSGDTVTITTVSGTLGHLPKPVIDKVVRQNVIDLYDLKVDGINN